MRAWSSGQLPLLLAVLGHHQPHCKENRKRRRRKKKASRLCLLQKNLAKHRGNIKPTKSLILGVFETLGKFFWEPWEKRKETKPETVERDLFLFCL